MVDKKKYKYLKFEKLVRDKNPITAIAKGCEPCYYQLEKDDFLQQLKIKLVEEANEVLEAKTLNEISDEIGDVIDVLKAIIKQSKIKKRAIRKSRRIKAKQRGGFKKGIYIKYVKCPYELVENWMYKYEDITDEIENNSEKKVKKRQSIITTKNTKKKVANQKGVKIKI